MRLVITIIGVMVIRFLMFPTIVFGQYLNTENNFVRLTKADSVYASRLPKLILPTLYKLGKAKSLPTELK